MKKQNRQYKKDQRERDKLSGYYRLELRVTEKEKGMLLELLKGLRHENNLPRLQTKKAAKTHTI